MFAYEVFGGVGIGGGEVSDDGFVDGGGVGVEHVGEAGAGVFEGLAQANELDGDGGGFGSAEADDADAAAAGGCGDGGNGVSEGVAVRHGCG